MEMLSECLPSSRCSFFHCEYPLSEIRMPTDLMICSSFVTSFFGMNTTDVRELDRDQGIFWSSAVPLTLAVSSLALVFGYKWDIVTALFFKAFRIQDSSRAFEELEKDLLSQLGADNAGTSWKTGLSSTSKPGISLRFGFGSRWKGQPWEKRIPERFKGLEVV